jgi:hypothetical protein
VALRVPWLAFQGILLFLFIPLVLFLLLRQPLGPGWSIAIGLAIMFGHRFLAQPWMAKFADVRCLWCGRVGAAEAAPVVAVPVVASGRTWPMHACSDRHAALTRRFLAFVFRFRLPIALGIFAPLAWLIAASLAAAVRHPLLPHGTNALLFRVVVAATVVVASLAPVLPALLRRKGAAARTLNPAPSAGPARCPFPLHNLFLLGIGNTLWVFRLVGAWWLVDALLRH